MHTLPSALPDRWRRVRALVAAIGAVSVVSGALAVATTSASAADLPATVLDGTATWRYSDNNTDPAAGSADRLVWTVAGFDDSAWKSGKGPFGAKNGAATPNLGSGFPVTTVLQQYIDPTATTKVDIPTEHFRTSFTVAADVLTAISGLTGTVTYDDAVQIFVNGTKVAGFVDARVEAVPDAQKNLTYAGNGGGDPVTSTFTVPASALQAGSNTIAIALYQDRSTSSDLYLHVKSLVPVAKPVEVPSFSDIAVGAGASASERIVTWTSSLDTAQVAQFAPSSTLVAGAFPGTATTVSATSTTASTGFGRQAVLSGLEPDTEYAYRVGAGSTWSSTATFRTQPLIDPNAQTLQVDLPGSVPGEFSWKIDGTNGLVDLGTATQNGDHFTATGAINPITVTDTRAGGPAWSVSAQAGDFRTYGASFSGKYLGWTPKVVTAGAGAVAGDPVASGFASGAGLSAASTLGRAAAAHPRGTATLGADLDLTLPLEIGKGSYRAKLTITALS